MIIVIEGMDGSGKSSISKKVAEKIGYEYLEKPLRKYLNMSDSEFENLCQKIYLLDDNLKALFFGFGNLLAMKTGKYNIILDKHILSTYFWNGTNENECLFNNFINMGIFPDLTIILYASIESRIRHIKIRSIDDKDLLDQKKMSFGYDKMIDFAEKSNMSYIFINGDELSFDEIVNRIVAIINECDGLTKEDILNYCSAVNTVEYEKNKKVKKLCFRGKK